MHSEKRFIPALGLLLAVLAVLSTPNAFAGFILTESDGTTTFVQGGKLRSDNEDADGLWTVIDMNKGALMMVNPEDNTYTEGTLDEYCAGMRKMMDAMSQFMGGMMPKPPVKKPKVEVVKVGSGGKIAGYETTRYKVMVDGVLREEVWLANDQSLLKEFGNPQTMAKFSQCGAMTDEFEAAPEYQGIMKAGWPLKSVSHMGGESETNTEVVRIEKADIPASKFAAPKGYTRTPLADAFVPMGQ